MLFHLCADTSALGRFDPSLLTDQQRMEMLVTPIVDEKFSLLSEGYLLFKNSAGEFLDIEKWRGVKCDDQGNVTSINWAMQNWACGEVSLDKLPPKLVSFDIDKGVLKAWRVRGVINTALLPRGLETLIVGGQAFGGTVDLELLPPPMIAFAAGGNYLEGTINLEALPKSMQSIELLNNNLEGTLCLTKLPASMRTLSLSENKFSGTTSLDYLPKGMLLLELDDNDLSGFVSLEHLPASLEKITLMQNFFQGEEIWEQKVR